MSRALDLARGQPYQFREDFITWLAGNLEIWERFEREAHKVYSAGRRHYSARTIGEYLRHETMLQAQNDGEFKLNNNRFPDMARLYLMLYPERADFFELRESPQRKVAA